MQNMPEVVVNGKSYFFGVSCRSQGDWYATEYSPRLKVGQKPKIIVDHQPTRDAVVTAVKTYYGAL